MVYREVIKAELEENSLLIIGNGFDLAHDLETGYGDFLDQLEYYSEFYKYIKREELSNFSIYEKLNSGVLLKYLKNTRDQNGWIDFENEIRNIIIAVSEFSSYLTRKVDVYKKKEYYFLIDNEKSKLPLFLLYVVENKQYFLDEYLINDKWTKKDLEKLYRKIHDEIINFIRLFRCYISWVNKFFMNQVQSKNIFENINITKILNFNYTDTFRKIYSNNLIDKDICWVHGRILDDGKGNIVMGSGSDFYDEKYEYFLDLFKFYQKYKYKTDMQYLKWAELNKENKI